MKKKEKKMISPLKTAQRILLIIHLSLIFTAIIWHFIAPFSQNIIQKKMVRNTFLELIGDPSTLQLTSAENRALQEMQNKDFQEEWQKLPTWEKKHIYTIMEDYDSRSSSNFWEASQKRIYTWLFQAPMIEKCALLITLLLPLLVLFRVEGARQALILLPIIAITYIGWIPTDYKPSYYEKLFPTESEIVQNHLKKPLSHDLFKQQEELREGWQLYLASTYPKSCPEFYFTKDKFYALHKDSEENSQEICYIPSWALLLYCLFSIWLCFSLRESKRAKPLLSKSG